MRFVIHKRTMVCIVAKYASMPVVGELIAVRPAEESGEEDIFVVKEIVRSMWMMIRWLKILRYDRSVARAISLRSCNGWK